LVVRADGPDQHGIVRPSGAGADRRREAEQRADDEDQTQAAHLSKYSHRTANRILRPAGRPSSSAQKGSPMRLFLTLATTAVLALAVTVASATASPAGPAKPSVGTIVF